MKLSRNANLLLKKRYLRKNNKDQIIETPSQMFRRVAKAVAKIDSKYRKDPKKAEKEFYDVMTNLDFLPNSPTLMNAGTKVGQLAACFVLPVEDSIESIFETLEHMAMIHRSGGGTGFNFSKLRPKGSHITTGKTSGPVSFIEIYNKATDVIKRGGKRRGANIGILNVDHPDIMEFISIKQKHELSNFGLSVALTDKFMDTVAKNKNFNLIDPKTRKKVKRIKAKKIFDAIIDSIWKTGDPGVIFLDTINRKNMLKLGRIISTNPCGEVPLYDYESCVLGSINLSNMVIDKTIDWDRLRNTVHIGVHFLDNVIDANRYPLEIIEKTTKSNRKIGLGVMGFADMLIELDIAYDSDQAVKTAESVMRLINQESKKASEILAKSRRPFPNFSKSKYRKKIRNAATTTIAPTGSLSMIADTSSGIEPLFAVSYKKMVLGGIYEFNKYYKRYAKVYKQKHLKELFKGAHEISKEQHVKIQAAFQKYTDNAVSKTVNLPNRAARNDVKKILMMAFNLKCKGITVYREGCREEEIICEECR